MSLLGMLFKKKKTYKRLGLALGGGGARGIAHIAFLKVFDDLGIRPSVISGTSMGALIGALYASGMSGRQIERTFIELNLVDMINMVDISWHNHSGMIKGEKITKTIKDLTRTKTFEDLDIPLKIIATDFWDRSEVILENGLLADAIRASISLPGIFEPVEMKNHILVDGGAVNSLPYELLQPECDLTVAINVLGEQFPSKGGASKPKIFESLLGTFATMESSIITHKLRLSQPDIYVKPSIRNIGLLDFHLIDEIITSVKEDARQFKIQLEQCIGVDELNG